MLLFHALHRSLAAQLTAVELLEAGGLRGLCCAAADERDAARRLGEVLAAAVAVGTACDA